MGGVGVVITKELIHVVKNKSLLFQLIFILVFSVVFPQIFAYSMISYERVTPQKVFTLIELGKYYPLMIGVLFASILAGESFAGERERKTMEILAATPLSAKSIFIGKLLFSILIALLLEIPTFMSFTSAVYHLKDTAQLNNIEFPTSTYLLACTLSSWSLTILVTTVVITASLLVKTKAAATTFAFTILLPIALLITIVSLYNITISDELIIAISALFLIVSITVLSLILKHISKELMILGFMRR